jgi:hypothetical protein
MISCRTPPFPAFSLLLLAGASCTQNAPQAPEPTGTPEIRAALFDSILAKTARREAFSVPKQEALGYDPLREMEELRAEFVEADTEDELYYALVRLSNSRRDRHLSVELVEGGIRPAFADGLPVSTGAESTPPRETPVRFRPDFGSGGYFVSDVAQGDAAPVRIEPGDRVAALNGHAMEVVETTLTPYIRHSSLPGLRWKLAEALSQRTALLPPSFLGDALEVEVRKSDGTRVREVLPYLEAGSLQWTGVSEPAYPGFRREWSTPTYDLYLPTEGQRALILRWHRFESSSLIQDVDRLVDLGEEQGLLDHAILFDATRSGGGSLGAYAVQRIQSKPFKTTFGTLRLSDVIEPFVQMKREEFAAQRIHDSGGPETVDDGRWLMDWLENDLLEALARGDSVTAPVPFKLAHAPKDSDGILQPAPIHFRGPLVVFSGPHGGSHLDQFMSIVADNGLGHIIGMSAGGYSNTWEWYEALEFPGTNRPVVSFMWSIGHTIRPNGEVLEGNPAPVHEPLPLTKENAHRYYELLLDRAWEYLMGIGFELRPT